MDNFVYDIRGVVDEIIVDEVKKLFGHTVEEQENKEKRILYLQEDIEDSSLRIVKEIIRYNTDDKGKDVEERVPIKLFIDSLGGDVPTSMVIVKAIKMSKTPVYTINLCRAYSAAGYILNAGHKRFAMPGSGIMIHNGSISMDGDVEKVESARKFFLSMGEELDNMMMASSSIPQKTFKKKASVDWYLTDKEALEYKIIDQIVSDYDEIC